MSTYDTVEFECPKCSTKIYEQSKAGKREMECFEHSRVPTAIATSLYGDELFCHGCGARFKIDTVLPPIQYVALKLIELKQEEN